MHDRRKKHAKAVRRTRRVVEGDCDPPFPRGNQTERRPGDGDQENLPHHPDGVVAHHVSKQVTRRHEGD